MEEEQCHWRASWCHPSLLHLRAGWSGTLPSVLSDHCPCWPSYIPRQKRSPDQDLGCTAPGGHAASWDVQFCTRSLLSGSLVDLACGACLHKGAWALPPYTQFRHVSWSLNANPGFSVSFQKDHMSVCKGPEIKLLGSFRTSSPWSDRGGVLGWRLHTSGGSFLVCWGSAFLSTFQLKHATKDWPWLPSAVGGKQTVSPHLYS